ncbi:TVP38/TMEM64 family protein [Magnetococcus sp. PR-3]|uniref:TVP38/TMEM64 family protein n=1 Tax=Magnetococcus sp. PR-3 TaxID=3120355 RepID=UPI002FCDF490
MKKRAIQILILVVLLGGIALASLYRDQLDPEALENWVQSFGWLAPLVFGVVYVLATVLFLPGIVITMAGGALFGPVWGTLYNLTAATIGAGIAFILCRYLMREWIESKAKGMAKKLLDGVEQEGWRFVAFTRLVPLFPFNLLNYAFGLTRVSFWSYLLASWLFMLPGTAVYTYLGFVGKEAATGGEGLMQKGLLALAMLALVSFLPGWIKKWRASRAEPVITEG